ncbi:MULTISPECIES: hypothetical protein [unclassified Modestobacter]|uniref:hypothetical protein n=1 Tax=unclassified Modestobacter TaxID=2643866 RepID=UPI0022AACFFB|nr:MULTISPECIES: hypothetical protein [unclassified Modestobacter]MCZ2813083.1 hypothetical protein [Modestobacter sp. VKM Ac-2979]MCZ2842888.1 hypothetical protein [Modestobacter sp. VKM Ac-2980]MCZ2847498.1 hypothetical protein [Modestobacter sp. VKM Ac-2978]
MKDPSPEAIANVTEHNVETRAQLLPEEQAVEGDTDPTNEGLDPKVQAAVILAESEERTVHADPDDAQGGHRQSAETADLP